MKEEYIRDYYQWQDVLAIVAQLRAPDGCPWDREQTFESMEQCLKDECNEVLEALQNKDYLNLKEELGDVLLQVLLQSEIAREQGLFTLEDVINELGQKLVRRHPHVFGPGEAEGDSTEALSKWNAMKKQEKMDRLREYEQWVQSGKITQTVMDQYKLELKAKGYL